MKRILLIALCIVSFVKGLTFQHRLWSEQEPLPVVMNPYGDEDSYASRSGLPRSGVPFTIDVSQMLAKLDELRPDERADQIADWAMYGTLLQANLSSDDLRQATYNIAPFLSLIHI